MFVMSVNRSRLEVHLERGTQSGCPWYLILYFPCHFYVTLHCIAFSYDLKIKKRLMTCTLSCVSIQSRFSPQGGRRLQGAGWANSSHCRRILSLYSIQQWVNIKILLSSVVCFRPLWHKCKCGDLGLFSVSGRAGSVDKKQHMNTIHGLRLILFTIPDFIGQNQSFASDTRFLLPTVLLYCC